MRVRCLIGLGASLVLLSACDGHPPALSYAPPTRISGQLPRVFGGGEAPQGHDGPSVRVVATIAGRDTGSEAVPRGTTGLTVPIATPPHFVLMPNGGEQPVQSVNALGSAPCGYCN